MSNGLWSIFPWLVLIIFSLLVRMFLLPMRAYSPWPYAHEGETQLQEGRVGILLFLAIVVAASILVLIQAALD